MKITSLSTICLVIILALTVQLAGAQGPITTTVYLPHITKGEGQLSTPWAVLEISDGTETVNLLQGELPGFHLLDWNPALPKLKGDGVWQDNAMATGRRLVDSRFMNVSDAMSFSVNGQGQIATINESSKLLTLLEKARAFGASNWQTAPVWLHRRLACETVGQYALIYDYDIPNLDNPYAPPFYNSGELSTMEGFDLATEHSIWLSNQPGAGECVETSGVQSWRYKAAWLLNTNQPASNVNSIIRLASLPNRMLAGDDNHLWRTDTGGAVWTDATIPPAIKVCTLVEDAAGTVYAAGQTGIWRSTDGGVNWVQRNAVRGAAYPSQNQALTIGDDGYLYLADGPNGFYKSTDGGATWNFLFADIGAYGIINSRLGLLALSTLTGVYRSTDNGATWVSIYTGDAVSMVADPGDGYIYLGTSSVSPTLLFRSTDGVTWDTIIVDPTLVVTMSFSLNIASDGRYYLLLGGPTVYTSLDGLTWSLSATLPSVARAFCEYTPTGGLYAGLIGDIYKLDPDPIDMGQGDTCLNQTLIANKGNIANLTHVWISDGGVFGPNLIPLTAPPVDLLPAVPAVGDAVYFGINTGVQDSGPFESLAFDLADIITFTSSYTIAWEYYNGAAWGALSVQDGTNVGTGAFRNLGVSSVHWTPPANWAAVAVNGVTGYWVRARVSALAGSMTPPSQQNRDIYTTVLPYVDIDADQVSGDIPALARFMVQNRSDRDGRAGSAPDLWTNRIIAGLRSYSRGDEFTAYLNVADTQNPVGVTVTISADCAYSSSPAAITGRLCTYTSALGHTTFADRVTFTLGPTVARDYYGRFHAYVRANVSAGASGDISAQLQVRTGSGGVTQTSKLDYLKGTSNFEVLDLGLIDIPASGLLGPADLGDSTVLALQFKNSSGAGRTVLIHDLILIPADENLIEATDYANISASIIGRQSSIPHKLDFDSVGYTKLDLRALVRTADGNEFVTSTYVPSSGPAILQSNSRQRLWFLAMRTSATGTAYQWLADPWIVHSLQITANERWLGFRGDR